MKEYKLTLNLDSDITMIKTFTSSCTIDDLEDEFLTKAFVTIRNDDGSLFLIKVSKVITVHIEEISG